MDPKSKPRADSEGEPSSSSEWETLTDDLEPRTWEELIAATDQKAAELNARRERAAVPAGRVVP